jgi:xylulokinase
MAGGGDQAAGAVGAGAVKPGVVALTLGTSGVVFAATESALVEPEGRLHAFCHAVPGRWHFMGVTLAAAGSLQWYRDTIAPGMPFSDLVAEAERVPAGSDGLFFTPYLSGERTPYPDPTARASFVGLTVRHTRAHMTRAVLEGVAYSMKDCMALLEGAGLAGVREIRIAGGGAKSELWRKIVASVLGLDVSTINSTEGGAFGAALLAGVGSGAWASVDAACEATIAITGRSAPQSEWADEYRRAYPRYRGLYSALKPTFAAS